jgi:outer membrane protein OmpA-like peptidoglycan-associated protein
MMMGLIAGLSIGLVLAAVGVGAYWLGRQTADDVATSADPEAASISSDTAEATTTPDADADADDGGATLAVDSTDGDATEDGSTAADEDAATEETASDDAGAADGQMVAPAGYASSDPNYETRIQQAPEYAVVRGGLVYLYGFAPDQATLDNSIAITEAVMGPDGYVVERFVDPDTPEVDGAPIYVDDKVLFGFNSTELDPAVLPILDLGVALMLQNPTAQMLIIARSDAVGSAEANLEVSQRRGDAVVEYWASKGVEPSRMTVEARGEADASESDSPEVAALNRSVEFVVSDIDPEG